MNDNESIPANKVKVLILVVFYNAEKTIKYILDCIPQEMWQDTNYSTEVLIIDNQFPDQTFLKANHYSNQHPERKISVLYNPEIPGYGGSLKIGYHYAIKNQFDVVVLLHGDGKFAPEYLPEMIHALLDNQADVVLGSRVKHPWKEVSGKMPFYKWFGSRILSFLQNRILHSGISEFHSGFRVYRVGVLEKIPFQYNADSIDFETDILIQLLDTGKKIVEIPVPPFHSGDIRKIHGIRYAWKVLYSCILSRLNRIGLYYHPKFDYITDSNAFYQSKFGYPSSHQFAYDRIQPGSTVLDLGCGPGFMAKALSQKNVKTVSVDRYIMPETIQYSWKCIEADINTCPFNEPLEKFNTILLLDILEHLKTPEQFLHKLREAFAENYPDIIITTGNIGFFPIRLNLLMGSFHFGKRGILDMDHTRLFTFASLCRLLENEGYEIKMKKGIPAPFPLAIGPGFTSRMFLAINQFFILLWKSLFAYQIAIQAKPRPTLDHLMKQAHQMREKLLKSAGE